MWGTKERKEKGAKELELDVAPGFLRFIHMRLCFMMSKSTQTLSK